MTGKHRTPRTPQRVTETSDYVAMMLRIIASYGDRIAEDPAALVHLRELQTALTDQVNRGIFHANKRDNGYSQNHMARILDTSRQAIAKRIGLGEQVNTAMVEARGGGALVRVGDVRARRAALLAEAGVEDKSGSARELAAGNVTELRRAVGQ